ncbi:hypothetical protein CRG98_029029 [Punica granatum]|uniref:Uncharacterized protein n=1 Tax=Punica granatum TaxID=22663 RepID=A0A2I0J2Y1_PUNGR|nr:hypothetical protein CRG98_029029 [Punica granatum]
MLCAGSSEELVGAKIVVGLGRKIAGSEGGGTGSSEEEADWAGTGPGEAGLDDATEESGGADGLSGLGAVKGNWAERGPISVWTGSVTGLDSKRGPVSNWAGSVAGPDSMIWAGIEPNGLNCSP